MGFEEEKGIKINTTFGQLMELTDLLQDGYRVNEVEISDKGIYFFLCKDVFIYDDKGNIIDMDIEKSDAQIMIFKENKI